MLEPDRAGGLQVLPERAEVEPAEGAGELEVDVQLLAALEGRVDRLHQLPVLVARDRAGGAKPEHILGQIGYPFDHVPSLSLQWHPSDGWPPHEHSCSVTRRSRASASARTASGRRPENVQFVGRAVAAGIGIVDTAHSYTDGESEATIGEALVAASGRSGRRDEGRLRAGHR